MLVSAVVGVGIGVLLNEKQQPGHRFLAGARVLSIGGRTAVETENNGYRSTRKAYLVDAVTTEVIQSLRSELPEAIEETRRRKDIHLFTVPRVENGRTRYVYPPAETIALVQAPQGNRTVVEISAFSRPTPFDGLISRLRKTLRI